jgi:hypothetical protein
MVVEDLSTGEALCEVADARLEVACCAALQISFRSSSLEYGARIPATD